VEGPIHAVTVRPFYMGKCEVTVEQFQRFVDEREFSTDAEKAGKASGLQYGAWKEIHGLDWRNAVENQTARHPVVCVSWNDAEAFCQWAGLRLPTEAEWECACRAGSKARFCFGDDDEQLKDYAWHRGNSASQPHPVGLKKPNVWGLHDMHGNVWEWCQDIYHDNYTGAPTDGAARVLGGDQGLRPLRGGSWSRDRASCRSAYRGRYGPTGAVTEDGFRVAAGIE
jgi:formylglycine-generating enzyme required for sulfatase activity